MVMCSLEEVNRAAVALIGDAVNIFEVPEWKCRVELMSFFLFDVFIFFPFHFVTATVR